MTTAPFDFYGETEWRDDMELGATQLYFALANADDSLPVSAASHRPYLLSSEGCALGPCLHHWAERRFRHPEPLRRERPGSFRVVSRPSPRLAIRAGLNHHNPSWLPTCEDNWKTPSCRENPTRSVSDFLGTPTIRRRMGPDSRLWPGNIHCLRNRTCSTAIHGGGKPTFSAPMPGDLPHRGRRRNLSELHAAPGSQYSRVTRRRSTHLVRGFGGRSEFVCCNWIRGWYAQVPSRERRRF